MHISPVRRRIRLPQIAYSRGNAFFITICTHNKSTWFRDYPSLCDTATQYLHTLASTCKVNVYAWCIMPDHIHLLLHGKMIIEFIRRLKGKMTLEFRKIKPKQRLWQRSFYDHALRKEESVYDVACYIWENPVRASIVEKPNEYLYSLSIVWPNWREFYGRGLSPPAHHMLTILYFRLKLFNPLEFKSHYLLWVSDSNVL